LTRSFIISKHSYPRFSSIEKARTLLGYTPAFEPEVAVLDSDLERAYESVDMISQVGLTMTMYAA
jgi:hypothetical protein